ncbi:hypothetical protein [Pandoraea pnomenusa]|uniref:hypothetical protein n=1 Tax=Pandoraea pnomenusa TaxID=93220 RepID=UPI0033429215
MEILSKSPDGKYDVRSALWEASASQWVYTPSIVNAVTGEVLYQPSDERWSAEEAIWDSANVVTLMMRRFPGNHVPAQISLRIDVCNKIASVNDSPGITLDQVDDAIATTIQLLP